MSAKSDQRAVLNYLHKRLADGDDRYCTIATIKKNTGLDRSNQYLLTLTDDLESGGFIITRQAYQMQGGRLFQITAAGFDAIEAGELPVTFDSTAWTGRINLTEHQKSELLHILGEMRVVVETARLSNVQTANAMALIEAAETLVDTPDPLLPEIMRLIRSPTLQGITGIASLLVGFIGIIMAAAAL
jgi:hypothetical protein